MRVICIESSTADPCDVKAICVRKGCIYNVTDAMVMPHRSFRGNTLYYQLLETGISWHNSIVFREIDDIPDNVEELELSEPCII